MMLDKLLRIDRRVIFVLIALAVIIPTATGLRMAPDITPRTQTLYDYVQALKPGSVVVIVFDYSPGSSPELNPMGAALVRHALRQNLHVLGMTLDPAGPVLADEILNKAGRELNKKPGVDYDNLGYAPGFDAVILQMGSNVAKAFGTDFAGRPYAELPITKGVRNYNDIAIVIDLASSATPSSWILQAHQRYGANVAAGVTAVMATDYYPYLQSKQLVGLLNGLKGAAEYERLAGYPGSGMQGMLAQSIAQFVIIVFVIFANVVYFISRRQARRAPAATGGGEQNV